MSGYYYLMAQLPAVLPGSPTAISYAHFAETASRFLVPADLAVLGRLSLEPPRSGSSTGSALVDRWFDRERALRRTLARLRAAKLKRETGSEDIAESDAYNTASLARSAVTLENPLEAERLLDRGRLAFIEDMASAHFFDSEAVFAYGLMLLLHERSDRFTADAGRASYTTIYNQILGE